MFGLSDISANCRTRLALYLCPDHGSRQHGYPEPGSLGAAALFNITFNLVRLEQVVDVISFL